MRSYGLFLATSFFVAILLGLKRAEKLNYPKPFILDLAVVVVLSAILGSRFFYVIFHLEEYAGHWLDIINPIQSSGSCGFAGFSMMGGVVFAIFTGYIFIRIRKVPFFKTGDLVAPMFLLGAGITRIGCFLNGCCFGKPTSCFLGVTFPSNSPAGSIFPNTTIYPTQLFASFAGFSLFLLLIFLERYKKFDGFTFLLMIIFYSIDRFVIDFFRYYENQMLVINTDAFSLTVNQLILIIMFFIAVILFLYKYKNQKTKTKRA
ncbi:prolipoprotein diacylglyceryl transferase [bacterium]|nr:prolipoprotein diacylglyceryl transferase [bacterium]